MFQKNKELAMETASHSKIYSIDIKGVVVSCGRESAKKKGAPKMQVYP
jgi:hypothetical protein